jgi:multisubunit Na+/H+ antiporter MnhB subunit
MIGRRTTILDEADRWLFPVILLVSVYVTFRGHNAPGGGFAGGMIAGCAFVLRFLAQGASTVSRSLRIAPTTLIGAGMLLAIATAGAPLFVGDSLIESHIWKFDLPAIGTVKLVSSSIFDLGVYVLVIGVVVAVLMALGSDEAVELGDDARPEVTS